MASACEIITEMDERGLPKVKNISQAEIVEGFSLFFKNKQQEAFDFFDKMPPSPLFTLGKGAILFARAVLSLEEKDIEECNQCVSECEEMVKQFIVNKGRIASFGRWLSGTKAPKEDSFRVHCEIMLAECRVLSAVLTFLQDSILDKVKALWNLHSAWQVYHRITEEQKNNLNNLDLETRTALQWGVGLFNLVCSILPPNILRVVSMFGFPSDRAFAIRELTAVFHSKCTRGPIAALALLFHHIGLQSTFAHDKVKYTEAARQVVDECLKIYPESGLFLIYEGRLKRMFRDIDGARACYDNAYRVQISWRQLNHFCHYELGFCHLFKFEWKDALTHFDLLFEENDWSKAFIQYICGLCLWNMGQKEEGLKRLNDVVHRCKRKFSGRPITVEEFVSRKIKLYVTETENNLVFPVYELLFLFNTYGQIPLESLKIMKSELEKYLETTEEKSGDTYMLPLLLSGCVNTHLENFQDAKTILTEVEELRKSITKESYIVPFGRYESGMLALKQHKPLEEVQSFFKAALRRKEKYDFTNALHFRVHMANYELKVPLEDDNASGELTEQQKADAEKFAALSVSGGKKETKTYVADV